MSPMVVTIVTVLLVRLSIDTTRNAVARDAAGDLAGAAMFGAWTLILLGVVFWLLRPMLVTLMRAPRPTARA